ncbi:hypothetical protein I302_100769 [Kwoniella bestiolae CBS 10118]|uniref:Uncharacterized protein n=1 Tax=Kwoniella bestiolae CBS 10118 TaxID=1296100 RepID=A0A1B9G5Z8_9TREE|nr:hypothetical protein I302_04142 [Kwoniella bestiolae CBS 10118]OCF26457.1 hypothetical protein I302_04142 [Kwoniella bestiolae CBS 10118]
MPSHPRTIPSRPSVSSTSTSTITSSSFEERRISQPTLLPSSPSTPLIISSCSSSSSSSSMRRSSSAPQPRRGSSLPSIPSSSTSTTMTSIDHTPSTTGEEEEEGPGPRMDILQFISSTIDPSWEEIENSPLSMVPSILPTTSDIDMVTFLREAPGVVRSPLSDSVTSFDDQVPYNPQDANEEDEMYLEMDTHRHALVTPELKQVSLRTFLEEENSRFNYTHIDDSPNPSSSISEIYGLGSCSASSSKLPPSSLDQLEIGPDNEHQLTLNEFLNGPVSRPQSRSRSRGRISTFDQSLISRSGSQRSTSSTVNSHKRVVSLNPSMVHRTGQLGLGLQVQANHTSPELDGGKKDHQSHGGVGKVMKFARDAFKIGSGTSR